VFTNKNRESRNILVCAVSLCVAETPKASVKEHETPLLIIPLEIFAYGFNLLGNLSRNSCIWERACLRKCNRSRALIYKASVCLLCVEFITFLVADLRTLRVDLDSEQSTTFKTNSQHGQTQTNDVKRSERTE